MSLEEKRNKLLEFFTQNHMFYNLKEIEQQGGKYVGIHPLQMKDLLQTLLDDNLIKAEKCGVTTIYWCFQYDQIKNLKQIWGINQAKLQNLQIKRDKLIEECFKENKLRILKDRDQLISKFETMEKIYKNLQIQFINSKYFDFDKLENIKLNLIKRLNIADICTDTIESLIDYFKKNNDVEREYFQNEFDIPEEFIELNQFYLSIQEFNDMK
ncbi:hypothetical protein WICMUC_003323 [Wickerhamomyces mucosus]|uniref:Meiotic nuclear division protein 1 n=1 Tax=Wickerhamomyces mucosus TaxID=1378264 RepID=A0A9P8PN01_9ASCO|nr:hypothetical protein WICMUC_003323 [Wickerhamomyces mucosus]